jgi:hypothetical protein
MVVQSALLSARRAWRPSGTDTGPMSRGGENPDYAALGAGSEGFPAPMRAADAKLFDSSHTEARPRLCRGRAVLRPAAKPARGMKTRARPPVAKRTQDRRKATARAHTSMPTATPMAIPEVGAKSDSWRGPCLSRRRAAVPDPVPDNLARRVASRRRRR